VDVESHDFQYWMKEALAEAQRVGGGTSHGQVASSSVRDVPVGCLILKDGLVVARGHNEREEKQDPTAHAELIAIRSAAKHLSSWRLTGCTLVVTLEPCPMCAEAIIQSRVSTLVFGAYDQRSGACGSAFNLFVTGRSYPLPEIIGGIEESECERMLADFFKSVRNRTE
jgi:tRNA(adenine34) deaminase